MTNTEMDAIEVQDAPVLLKRTLSPRFKLLGERLVEATDRTGTGSDSHEGLRDFSHLVGARACHKHLGESLCDVRFIATVTLKRLGVELPFTISGHLEIFEPTRGGHEIAAVVTVAVPLS